MDAPARIAITGAAGQIAYSLLFRIAAGDLLGRDRPVVVQLLEITPALGALKGVVMELSDCAFPLLQDVTATDDAATAFRDADCAFLVGARPRTASMERRDLLAENGKIFAPQGRALNEHASRGVKVLVVGNPANTNALIAMRNAPDLDPRQFTAMTRLDHNRAVGQVAERCEAGSRDVRRVAVWGNHSATQYPDLSHATVRGRAATDLLDETWIRETFIPRVQRRGTEIIEARGASSAASAAHASLDHMRDWVFGTREGDWVSMAVPSDGSYGIPEGVIYSYPVTTAEGACRVVPDLAIDDFSRAKMDATLRELQDERDAVRDLL